jgi:hypothetical protein
VPLKNIEKLNKDKGKKGKAPRTIWSWLNDGWLSTFWVVRCEISCILCVKHLWKGHAVGTSQSTHVNFFLHKDGCKHPTRTAFITSLKFCSQAPKSKEKTNKPKTIIEKTLDQKAKAIRSKLCLCLQINADANLGLHRRRRGRATWRRRAEVADERSRCSGGAAALQPYSLAGWRSMSPISHQGIAPEEENQALPSCRPPRSPPPPWKQARAEARKTTMPLTASTSCRSGRGWSGAQPSHLASTAGQGRSTPHPPPRHRAPSPPRPDER